eukprot:PITA_27284
MIEDSRMTLIHQHISSTLIALIPKKRDADTFHDFRPISLCNISFKIISKIIAKRIKGTLATHLSKDQHSFLKGRNILDAVANTQECMYTMFSKDIDAAILKIDLQKAYDCIDWGYIRCLLAKIGLRLEMINWIMECIENVNHAININGIPSPYFLAERGLRQGCPLAPIIFILAMNTLSLHINKAVDEHRCRPIKTAAMFGVVTCPLPNGITYLGFHLKANKYSAKDWEWLIERYYKKISSWEYKTLSLAGRVILSSAVLSQLSVYWAHFFYLPSFTIQRLNKITANFIWGGLSAHRKFHLVKMDAISIPK